MKNTQIQKTTPVSQFLIEKQIMAGCSTGSLALVRYKCRLGVIVGLVTLSMSIVSHKGAIAAENSQSNNSSSTISEKEPSGNKEVVSSLTVPLESTEKEPKPVLQTERKEILQNQISTRSSARLVYTPRMQLKTSLDNLQQTSSLRALKQEESKLKNFLAAGPIKVSDATQTKVTTNEIALQTSQSSSNTLEESTSLETAVVIPVSSPEVQGSDTENPTLPQVENSPTLVKSTEIEVPSVVSPQQKEDFNSTTIEVIKPELGNTPQIYKVQQGDTLNKIAYRYGVSVSELMKLNRIANPNLVKIAQELVIPERVSSAPSVEIQTAVPVIASSNSSNLFETNSALPQNSTKEVKQSNEEKISNVYASKLKSQVVDLEQTSQSIPVELTPTYTNEEKLPKPNLIGTASWDSTVYPGSVQIPVDEPANPEWLNNPGIPGQNLPSFTGYIWPTKGLLTSGYGRRWGRMHKGIDIASSVGTPVVAAAPGEVISAGWNSGGYGNLVVIRHADGSVTYYAHNSRVLVRTGQIVQQGEQVSAMGSTGRSTGPHLHFEVHPDGRWAVNPIAFLPNSRQKY